MNSPNLLTLLFEWVQSDEGEKALGQHRHEVACSIRSCFGDKSPTLAWTYNRRSVLLFETEVVVWIHPTEPFALTLPEWAEYRHLIRASDPEFFVKFGVAMKTFCDLSCTTPWPGEQ